MNVGDRVRVPGNRIETISKITTCQIFTTENTHSWYHPRKVYPLYYCKFMDKYLPIGERVIE
jgi:hypothetical protein